MTAAANPPPAQLLPVVQADRSELRRLPILTLHFPSAPSVDFTDADQRMVIRCSCGETFRERESSRVIEHWALHAMDAQAQCGGIPVPEAAHPPERGELASLVEALEQAAARRIEKYAQCPIERPRCVSKPPETCPRCLADRKGTCFVKHDADYRFISEVEAALQALSATTVGDRL